MTSGQSTGSTTQTSVGAARRAAASPRSARARSVPSSSSSNGSGSASAALPTASRCAHASPRVRQARSASVSPLEACERLRGAEAGRGAADEQDARQAVTRHGSL